ncbi:MAG: cobalt ECF transporter T component CbiQ [Clostridium sp.]|nr:cobalt ECF transporter T component CbiQ [Clostridium sp.]
MEIPKYKSELDKVDGRIKTVVFLSCIIVSALLSRWYLIAGIYFIGLIIFSNAKISFKKLIKRLLLPFGLSWLVFLSVIFTNGSDILTYINFGVFKLDIYLEGIQMGLIIQLRIMTAVTFACLLSFTTPMEEILETLRILKIPNIVIDIASMMFRYMFIMSETLKNVKRAQISRMGESVSWFNKIVDLGKVASCVLIKSIDKSVNIYNAMLSRGYTGEAIEYDFFNSRVPRKDLLFAFFIELILILAIIFNIII